MLSETLGAGGELVKLATLNDDYIDIEQLKDIVDPFVLGLLPVHLNGLNGEACWSATEIKDLLEMADLEFDAWLAGGACE